MFSNIVRRTKPAALALGAMLLHTPAQAQVIYTYAFPQIPVTNVLQWDGSTAPTGGDPIFNPLTYNTGGSSNPLPPPNAFVTTIGQTQTYYRTRSFTITATGLYNVTLTGLLTNSTGLQGDIYKNSFNPASPFSNLVQQIQGVTSGTATPVPVSLTPGNYVFVVAGAYNGAVGSFNVTITQAAAPVMNGPNSFIIADGSTAPTGASPQFNRPRSNGNLPPNLASFGSNYSYESDAFKVTTSGLYQINSDDTAPNIFQGQIQLYQNSFDPANPLLNCLQVSGPSSVTGPTAGNTSMLVNLTAGTQYYLVTCNYLNGSSPHNLENKYTNTISPAAASTLDTWTGTTIGGPTFNRPNQTPYTGAAPTTLSGTAATYDTHTFTAQDNGYITVTSTCTTPAAWDNFLVIYTGKFNPSAPLTNILAAVDGGYDDDGNSLYVTQGEFPSVASYRFYATQGQKYTIVTSGNASSNSGAYAGTITADPQAGNAVVTLTGALEPGSGGNVFKRPNAGATVTSPPTAGAFAVPYNADPFTITTDGNYTIVDSVTVPSTWGIYFLLYQGSFDPANPLNNVIAATGGDNSRVQFNIHLAPGTYYAVTTGYGNLAYGSYEFSVEQAITGATPFTYSDTFMGGTGTTFTRPNVPPATLSSNKNVYYQAHNFTVPATGTYNIDAVSDASGTDITGKWDDFVVLYGPGGFNPGSPTSNAIASNDMAHLFGPDAGLRNQALTAGTNYTLVVSGGGFSSFAQFGTYHASVYTGGGEYPPIIPDNTAGGLSAVDTVADTFTVLGLNSVTITGLYHPHAGDLLATLSHGGVTIELTDRVDRTTTNTTTTSTTGSSAEFFGDYTFAATGASLGAAAVQNYISSIDATQPYAPFLNIPSEYSIAVTPNGSSTLTGNFDAFDGMSVNGAWTLKIADLNAGSIGAFSGFSFNVVPTVGTVTGKIALEGVNNLSTISAGAPLGTFHVSFRIPGTTTELHGFDAPLTNLGATGTFTLNSVPTGTYDVNIEGSKNLSVTYPSSITVGAAAVSLPDETLGAGDANGDNVVDTSDFNILAGAFGAVFDPNVPNSTTGYDPTPDFNFDGTIDTSDFNILVGEFGNTGS